MYQGKKIIQPPFLKAGDKVALVSPAYWVPQEAILQAAETIISWGLQPVLGPHTNNLNVNAYAGTADERAADLMYARPYGFPDSQPTRARHYHSAQNPFRHAATIQDSRKSL